VLGQLGVAEQSACAGPVEAEHGPFVREVFELYPGERGVVAKDLTRRVRALRFGVHEDVLPGLQDAQVRLHAAFRVQQ
jgi:hypothetical protein